MYGPGIGPLDKLRGVFKPWGDSLPAKNHCFRYSDLACKAFRFPYFTLTNYAIHHDFHTITRRTDSGCSRLHQGVRDTAEGGACSVHHRAGHHPGRDPVFETAAGIIGHATTLAATAPAGCGRLSDNSCGGLPPSSRAIELFAGRCAN